MEEQLGQEHAVLDAAEAQGPLALAGFQRAKEEEVDRAYHHADLGSFAFGGSLYGMRRNT
jgi:hypothetical protein